MTSIAARLKDRSPRAIKDVANASTRGYAVATSFLRPYPDFLLVGTKRGGTTSLWNYLVDHPAVLPMFPGPRGLKSPEFFFGEHSRGTAWYRSHFHTGAYRAVVARRLGAAPVTGEASPYYMWDPRVCDRVSRLMPATKAIMLLRDPVKRAYSHYQERVGQGVEPLSFADALAAEEERTAGELERMLADPAYYSTSYDWYSYRARGVYGPQVTQWRATLPADQLLVLVSEELYRDPQATLDRVSDFLGIPHHRATTFERHNFLPVAPMDDAVRRDLAAFYRPHNAEVYALLGRDLRWTS